ncbi:AraC family transcriptional regulator [Bradyrhizobium liaoningense]|uniref:AraC family transcriptional regulator n=1 Tax=Bradyrhizobium liaoningense TaxID=43992 RepID=UPI001BADB61F|nr:AraC family transcriptional regulator [Bradyrhizobium liaoningense]MBR0716618.1 AraC family transcriptional regulator [Bradyrhizobium liaoningense]
MARRDTGNYTTYWQSRLIPGLSLLHADFSHHDYAPHTHDAFVIAVTESGSAEIANRDVTAKIDASTLFVSNPEERQSARMGDSVRWRYRAFYLTQRAICDIARRFSVHDMPYFMENMIGDADLIARFRRLHRALASDDDDLLADELAIEAFSRLVGRYGSGGGRPEPAPRDLAVAKRLLALMRERYAENLSLDDLARTADLTSFQVIGLFKRTVGLTPHAYLLHIRMNAACRHLKRGHSLAESAQAAGFCDQAAMNKHFKRSYGITPLQFAQATRDGPTGGGPRAISANTTRRQPL